MIAVQCWDDGVLDDIRLIEILRKSGAKASFNLNIGRHREKRFFGWKHGEKEVWMLSKGELRDVYDDFLVANHTLTHPSLPEIPPEKASQEIREGRAQLEQWFGYEVKGFAYPFGTQNKEVGEMVRAEGHLYARTVQAVSRVLPVADTMHLDPSCHFLDPEFWTKFEEAKAADNIFYFWGHSYEIMNEDDWRDFAKKIERISREAQWMDLPDLFK